MKYFYSIIFVAILSNTFSQDTAKIDSAQYNLGHTIGENIPVAILMIFALLFIYKSYRNRNNDKPKTDFMDDGTIDTIDKEHFR